MSRKPDGDLRFGWTTGACASAATRAACQALLTGRFPDSVSARLPQHVTPAFPLALHRLSADAAEPWAEVGIIKDAGDDPDVTHGAMIIVRLAPSVSGAGLSFHAGAGVGIVTRPGLQIPPGDAAINPGPRRMIAWALKDAADDCGRPRCLDYTVTISIPGGEELAKKTLNSRLGIESGLSILGTTGIVTPYSCASWIHSIHRGIDVARAMGLQHLVAATGSTSEAAMRQHLGLPEQALIDMGDFVGSTLKYLRRHRVDRLTLAGGFAKIAKLAQGEMDLHSGSSQVDIGALTAILYDLGVGPELVARAKTASSAGEILSMVEQDPAAKAALTGRIAVMARDVAMAELAGVVAVDIAIVDRAGNLTAVAGP